MWKSWQIVWDSLEIFRNKVSQQKQGGRIADSMSNRQAASKTKKL